MPRSLLAIIAVIVVTVGVVVIVVIVVTTAVAAVVVVVVVVVVTIKRETQAKPKLIQAMEIEDKQKSRLFGLQFLTIVFNLSPLKMKTMMRKTMKPKWRKPMRKSLRSQNPILNPLPTPHPLRALQTNPPRRKNPKWMLTPTGF